MSTIKIEDAEGRWVLLTGISSEPDNWGRITGLRSTPPMMSFRVHDHSTCGNFGWEYPEGTELEVKPLPPAARRKK